MVVAAVDALGEGWGSVAEDLILGGVSILLVVVKAPQFSDVS